MGSEWFHDRDFSNCCDLIELVLANSNSKHLISFERDGAIFVIHTK